MSEDIDNAYVTGNSLVSFSDVDPHHRNDILDLLMYADFFATQTWRPHSNWTSWIEYYRKQLTYSGCQLKSQIVKQPMVISSARELDNVSFGVTGSVRVKGLMDLARRSFRTARLCEQARHFFEFGTGSGYFSHFQIVPCETVGTDEVSILVCGLHARASVVSDSRGGDWRVNREMVVRLAGGVYTFNGQSFSPHRQRIQSRLLEVGRSNIHGLSI
jgi:hypothetical protein